MQRETKAASMKKPYADFFVLLDSQWAVGVALSQREEHK